MTTASDGLDAWSGSDLADTDALTRLANELFAALPGEHPKLGGALDAASAEFARQGGIAGLTPTTLDPAALGLGSIPGIPSIPGVPAIPGVTASGLPGFGVPGLNGLRVPEPQLNQGLDGHIPTSTRVLDVPLPCEQELRQLLGDPVAGVPTAQASAVAAPFSTAPQLAPATVPPFYFLDGVPASAAGGHALPRQAGNLAGGFAHPGTGLDVLAVRRDFPILREHVNGRPLVWFDNAATTQKPQSVIDRISWFYAHENSNIHRAAHELAARATDAYEGAREISRRFVNARSVNEVVFVRGTTEAINLVAKSWGRQNIGEGDEIVISHLEHHANIVPWQQLIAETGAKLRVAPVDDSGQIILEEYAKLLNSRTKLVSFTQVSNALGTITPAAEMVRLAHAAGARVLVDGAQSVSHLRADVQALDCDWFVFSGHKIFGPTGIGVLYGKEELLNSTGPWQGGGNMIRDVTFEKTEYHDAPGRFEAGTGNIADAVGLGAALEYVERLGIENIAAHEHALLSYGMHHLGDIPGLRLVGTATHKASVMSFVLDGFSTEEVGKALNQVGIAVRTGHHCAQPILRRFGLEATVRPSLALYNTYEEIDLLVETVRRLKSGRR